jgi:hypothetical protein
MNYVEVYMLESVTDRGTRKEAGYIYSVEQHIADQLVSDGKALLVDFKSLKAHEVAVEKLAEEFEKSVAKINANYRLSPEGKAEEIAVLKEELEKKVDEYQQRFNEDLRRLKEIAKEKSLSFDSDGKVDADKVRQTVGIIKADVEMASSFTEAIELLQSQIKFIDRDSARELLSQFTEIKAILEKKGETMNSRSDEARRYAVSSAIRKLYDDLKKVAVSAKQEKALVEYKMLEAIEMYRSDIKEPARRVLRKY